MVSAWILEIVLDASASCYIIDQKPGAERYGGLKVTIDYANRRTESIVIIQNDWKTKDQIEEDIAYLTDAALVGIRGYVDEQSIDLLEFKVTLSEFAYHPVDSDPLTFELTAYQAMSAAWIALNEFGPLKLQDGTEINS